MNPKFHGAFCISLDFEKYWGVHDIFTPEEVEDKMIAVGDIVRKTLDLFEKYEIHATWATVGLLFDENPAVPFADRQPIPYENQKYSPFPIHDSNGVSPQIFSGKKEISWVLESKDQEIASHSFSHLYGLESGIGLKDITKDTEEMNRIAEAINSKFSSIVFPRNQVSELWLNELKINNYKCFRGNQEHPIWSNDTYGGESKLKRLRRWSEAYFGSSKTKRRRVDELEKVQGLVSIPASRFLRPVSKYTFLESRKVAKIRKEMTESAKQGYLYHLWWHPHNFAEKESTAFEQLENILRHFQKLRESHDFQSLNMGEIAAIYD